MPTAKTSRPARRPSPRCVAPAKHNWLERTSSGLRILQVPAFTKLPWLIHGFSTRLGGVSASPGVPAAQDRILNLGFTDWDDRANILENRRRFQSALGAGALTLVPLKQIHSDIVQIFNTAFGATLTGDASLANQAGVLLAIQTADCVPILLVDPRTRAIAAVHAGWRGTLKRIVAKTIGQMQMRFGAHPGNILAALGPSIGPCCYDVGAEVATQFASQFANAADFFDELRTGDEPNPLQWLNQMPPGHQPPPKNVFLDLRQANRSQLLDAGLRPQNIFISNLCTACRPDLLFSYRKQGPQSGRQIAAIALRS